MAIFLIGVILGSIGVNVFLVVFTRYGFGILSAGGLALIVTIILIGLPYALIVKKLNR